jgi:uncharacterized repeat protein (TIGR01451 family)
VSELTGDICDGWINNTVNATAENPCGGTVGPKFASVNVTTDYNSDFTVTKVADPSTDVSPGDVITYNVTVTNTGDVNLTNVRIEDDLTSTVWTIPRLNVSETNITTFTYVVDGTTENLCDGWINNTVNATAENPCGGTVGPKFASANVTTTLSPSISITKTADYGPYPENTVHRPGTVITYWINVTNTGDVNLTNVNVTDARLGLENVTFSDDLGAGVSVNRTYTYVVNETDMCDPINNTAVVNATDVCDDSEVSDTDSWSIPVNNTESVDLHIVKTANVTIAYPGDEISYLVVVTNTGNVNATKLNVTYKIISRSATSFLNWTIPVVSPGGNDSRHVNYTVTEGDVGQPIWNIVNITDYVTPCGYRSVNIWMNEFVPTDYNASLIVEKTADYGPCPEKPAGVGTNITYTINVTNMGDVNLTSVNITDPMFNLSGFLLTDLLRPGESVVGTFYHVVNESELFELINNTVFANATDPLEIEVNDSDSWCVPTNVTTSNLSVTKTPDKDVVRRGEEITYTISICNVGTDTVTNVLVSDIFDRYVELVSISYTWVGGSHRIEQIGDGLWLIDVIPPNECVNIILVVKVPKQDLEFEMDQSVNGEGFVNVANDYSTTLQPYAINNNVVVIFNESDQEFSDSARVSVLGDPGTELETREHGSGLYESEEQVRLRTENKSISMNKDIAATYKSTILGLYNNRTVEYSSRWTEVANAKNRVTGASMSEQYRYATSIDRESNMFLDKNGSTMEVDSEFDGMGHIGFLKMPSGSSFKAIPIFESREDYTGSFKILEKVDEYGSGVSSEKSASGAGLVAVDKRTGDSQRSYESGAGSYDSEELVETYTNYIAKDISLVSGSMNQSLTDDFSIDASMKWKEGMYSKTSETSYIGEEYTGVTQLDKETVAKGLNEMDTEANFSGSARYRAVLKDEVDFDEEYVGDYSIQRRVLFTGVPKYDRPHLNVTKSLENITEETIFDAKEETLAGESRDKVIEVATYTIRIENDGNRALIPVYVKDIFPPGAKYINASKRPSELTDTYANWTLTHLSIGDVAVIVLKLDVTKYYPDELVNRVVVTAGYDGEWITASNFSAIEVDWLTCCPNETVSVTKTATIDPVNDSVVRYRVEIKNDDDVTRVATVTDRLPAGMELVESSTPFASYDGDVVVWNLIEIPASGTVAIEFSALAPGAGRFVNTVEVDARSVDGPAVQPVTATCVIDVGVVEEECDPVSCGTWQPPSWEMEHFGYGQDLATCEDLTCTSCDGTGSCLAP